MKYSDEQRIEKILNYAVKLQNYISENNVTEDKLLNEEKLQWLVTTPLYNIGEHTYNLSKEFKENHSNIQWNSISGLRHRLVHDYEGIKWNNISEILFNELPIFTEQLRKICKENGWEISPPSKSDEDFSDNDYDKEKMAKENAALKRKIAMLEKQLKSKKTAR